MWVCNHIAHKSLPQPTQDATIQNKSTHFPKTNSFYAECGSAIIRSVHRCTHTLTHTHTCTYVYIYVCICSQPHGCACIFAARMHDHDNPNPTQTKMRHENSCIRGSRRNTEAGTCRERATDTDTRKKTKRKNEKENTYIATLNRSCFAALRGIHGVGVFHQILRLCRARLASLHTSTHTLSECLGGDCVLMCGGVDDDEYVKRRHAGSYTGRQSCRQAGMHADTHGRTHAQMHTHEDTLQTDRESHTERRDAACCSTAIAK